MTKYHHTAGRMNRLSLYSVDEIALEWAQWCRRTRKKRKLSREALADISTVPASTLRKFETTGQISLRQWLLLWQSLDHLDRLHALTREPRKEPTTIEEVLKGDAP